MVSSFLIGFPLIVSNLFIEGVIHMQMDRKMMKIQRDLQERYLKTFEPLKDKPEYHIYETMVKLNAEMVAIALQRYKDDED